MAEKEDGPKKPLREKSGGDDLLKKLAGNLEKTFDETVTDVQADEPEEKDEPTPDPDEEKEKGEEAESSDADEPTPEKDDKEPAKDDSGDKDDAGNKPELSDAYYRAAKHSGWSDEDIDNLMDNNPELCVKTLAKVYEDTNRASQDFAAIGRAQKEAARKTAETKQTATEAVKSEFKGIDIEQLKRENPDNPLLVQVIETQQTQSKVLHDQMAELRSRPERNAGVRENQAADREQAALRQQIDAFFKSDEAQAYGDFYGSLPKDATDWDSLTPGQRANRWAVLEESDYMITGANTCGRTIETDEALRKAHLTVSAPMHERVVRDKIVKQVKERSKSLSLKPSSKTSSVHGPCWRIAA